MVPNLFVECFLLLNKLLDYTFTFTKFTVHNLLQILVLLLQHSNLSTIVIDFPTVLLIFPAALLQVASTNLIALNLEPFELFIQSLVFTDPWIHLFLLLPNFVLIAAHLAPQLRNVASVFFGLLHIAHPNWTQLIGQWTYLQIAALYLLLHGEYWISVFLALLS